MMRWLFMLLLCCLAIPAAAQQDTPGYVIRNIRQDFANGNRELMIQFNVINLGGQPGQESAVSLVNDAGVLAEQSVRALAANELATINFTVETARLNPGIQTMRILVNAGGQELASATIGVNVPQGAGGDDDGGDGVVPGGGTAVLGLALDLENPLHLVALAGFCLAGLLALFLVFLLLRVLFRRDVRFPAWQSPYAVNPLLNPNSQAARRRGWQAHAQNDAPPMPGGGEGAVHVRKVLADERGMVGWEIRALRLVAYDQYGRIGRTETVAPTGAIKRLDAALRRVSDDTPEQTLRRVRPVARGLVRLLGRHINKRSAILPVAVDIRLHSREGQARILFELFMVQQGSWNLLDRWQPELAVPPGSVEENMTYSLYGMRPNESLSAYRKRLEEDLTQLLVGLIRRPHQSST